MPLGWRRCLIAERVALTPEQVIPAVRKEMSVSRWDGKGALGRDFLPAHLSHFLLSALAFVALVKFAE